MRSKKRIKKHNKHDFDVFGDKDDSDDSVHLTQEIEAAGSTKAGKSSKNAGSMKDSASNKGGKKSNTVI
jgi:hypothetical protein